VRFASRVLQAIARARRVDDLEVLDINYCQPVHGLPCPRGVAASEPQTSTTVPVIYRQQFRNGSFTNPDRQAHAQAQALIEDAIALVVELGADCVRFWPGQEL